MSHIYSQTQKKYNDAWVSRNRDYHLGNMRRLATKSYNWKKISKIFREILLD